MPDTHDARTPTTDHPRGESSRTANGALAIVRRWLPYSLMLVGLLIVAAGGATELALSIGIPIFSAGASIKFLNALIQLGHAGDEDRDREAEARTFYAEHGRWPADEGRA